MAGTQAQADHAKWLGTLRAWVPTEPSEVLVALIDSLVEASGPARIEALDALIARTDGTTRSGREKFERLRRWSDKIRAEHPFWPQRIERPRAVSSLIKAILDKASHALDRSEVERKYRKVRPVPPSGLSQELKEMAKRGEIDRHAAGLYWRKGTAGTLRVSDPAALPSGTRRTRSSDAECRTGSRDGPQQEAFGNAAIAYAEAVVRPASI